MSASIIAEILNLAHTFKRHGLQPPERIVLRTHDDGMLLLSQLQQIAGSNIVVAASPAAAPILIDGAPYMSLQVLGMEVLWPAKTPARKWVGKLPAN